MVLKTRVRAMPEWRRIFEAEASDVRRRHVRCVPVGCSVDAKPARDLMTEKRKQNQVALREQFLKARQSGEMLKGINLDDYTQYLSSIIAGLSIQAANGSTKTEHSRIAQLALRHLGF